MTPAVSLSVASHFLFPITLEEMHQIHLNFTKGSSIIKYRSSSIKGVIHKILSELWPYFEVDLG